MNPPMNESKLAITALLSTITAFWGDFAWLVLLWLSCLTLDYIAGTLAGAKEGEWSSRRAMEGIWHKVGCIVAVMVAAGADILLRMASEHLPGFQLEYQYLLCPMVLAWYSITELGSITENAVRMGAPVPEVLKKTLQMMKDASNKTK